MTGPTARPIDVLRSTLANYPDGAIEKDAHSNIERLLADAWDKVRGSNDEQMTARKLLGRTEQLIWRVPVLSFVIERHGALVGGGSTRGELQHWQVNIDTGEARYSRAGHRQLKPAAPPLRVNALAEQIVGAITRHEINTAVVWISATQVRVMPSRVEELQSGFKQTVTGRRKRFMAAVDIRLMTLGWSQVPSRRFVYEKPDDA